MSLCYITIIRAPGHSDESQTQPVEPKRPSEPTNISADVWARDEIRLADVEQGYRVQVRAHVEIESKSLTRVIVI